MTKNDVNIINTDRLEPKEVDKRYKLDQEGSCERFARA
jgi:hypothetical protein